MELRALIEGIPGLRLHLGEDGADPDSALRTDIARITADSRTAGPGTLFAALPGAKADGRSFIARARAAGA
ncbi:MAG: UDP-N-acetylmuramoyl-L-alanyl-D-glutamate--2,6-diaminopimelate ligase, partial [Alphaproteobacteria bacterium]|nr:UDP-N-acetylmuramoyl-L-alanyl-D-glutamate--2,6-diaminopimelate ligase [Alphaproteobacteria bacterium]